MRFFNAIILIAAVLILAINAEPRKGGSSSKSSSSSSKSSPSRSPPPRPPPPPPPRPPPPRPRPAPTSRPSYTSAPYKPQTSRPSFTAPPPWRGPTPSYGSPTSRPSYGSPTNRPSYGSPTNRPVGGSPTNRPVGGVTSRPAGYPTQRPGQGVGYQPPPYGGSPPYGSPPYRPQPPPIRYGAPIRNPAMRPSYMPVFVPVMMPQSSYKWKSKDKSKIKVGGTNIKIKIKVKHKRRRRLGFGFGSFGSWESWESWESDERYRRRMGMGGARYGGGYDNRRDDRYNDRQVYDEGGEVFDIEECEEFIETEVVNSPNNTIITCTGDACTGNETIPLPTVQPYTPPTIIGTTPHHNCLEYQNCSSVDPSMATTPHHHVDGSSTIGPYQVPTMPHEASTTIGPYQVPTTPHHTNQPVQVPGQQHTVVSTKTTTTYTKRKICTKRKSKTGTGGRPGGANLDAARDKDPLQSIWQNYQTLQKVIGPGPEATHKK